MQNTGVYVMLHTAPPVAIMAMHMHQRCCRQPPHGTRRLPLQHQNPVAPCHRSPSWDISSTRLHEHSRCCFGFTPQAQTLTGRTNWLTSREIGVPTMTRWGPGCSPSLWHSDKITSFLFLSLPIVMWVVICRECVEESRKLSVAHSVEVVAVASGCHSSLSALLYFTAVSLL